MSLPVTAHTHAASSLLVAAASCDDAVNRLHLDVTAASDGIIPDVMVAIDFVSASARNHRANAMRLCASRTKHLDWRYEEYDASKAVLEGLERQLRVCEVDLEAIDATLMTVEQLVSELETLPMISIAMSSDNAISSVIALNGMSHVQVGVSAGRIDLSRPLPLQLGEGTTVTLTCVDSVGAAVARLTTVDVSVTIFTLSGSGGDAIGWLTSPPCVIGEGVVSVAVAPQPGCVQEAVLLFTVCGGFTRSVVLRVRLFLCLF